MRRRLSLLLGLVLTALLLAELTLRLTTGLGRPLLYVSHPRIEYMLRPDQDVVRQGNRLRVNAQSMRSGPLPLDPNTSLVLVLGDSVVNGSEWTDHAALATSVASEHDPDRYYANISANSWGPANQRAYLETYGVFGADTTVIVLSAHDIDDVPTFAPLHPLAHPVNPPKLALTEAFWRYGPRYAPDWLRRIVRPKTVQQSARKAPDRASGEAELRLLFRYFSQNATPVCVLLHPTQAELGHRPSAASERIRQLAEAANIPYLALEPYYTEAPQEAAQLYRDNIHLNDAGQAVLAQALTECRQIAAVPIVSK